MRILLVTRVFTKNEGVAKCVVELTERLIQNHEVFVLTSDYDYEISKLEKVYKIPVMKKPFSLQVLYFALAAKYYIAKIKQEENIDVVNVQKTEALAGDIVTMHSCHRAAIKENNKLSKQNLNYFKYLFYKFLRWVWPLNRIRLFIEKRILERAEKVISVSRGVKREIIENYNTSEKKIKVIQNGVDIKTFCPNKNFRKEIRNKHDIREKETIGFFCAHEFRRKGLKYIIRALPKLNQEMKVLVAGKDNFEPYRKTASELEVEEKLIYVGNITEGIEKYYAASDIFLFPTKYEAFSLATLEAMASGLPLITTKVNGTEELVNEGKNGYFVKRNSDEVASKINKLLGNPNLLAKMKRNARETAKECSWGKVVQENIKIYRSLLEKHG